MSVDEPDALYRYTVAVYKLMEERAKELQNGEVIFEGYLTEIVDEVCPSRAYYSPIRKLLVSPDTDPCILHLQRGTGSQVSRIRLMHAPPEEWRGISRNDLTTPRRTATVTADLERRLAALEGWREMFKEVNIVEALKNHERRIARLEGSASTSQDTEPTQERG